MQKRIHLFLDWDGTLTHRDTTPLIGRVGSNHQIQRPNNGTSGGKKLQFKDPWNDIVRDYTNDFNHHQETYEPKAAQRQSITEEQKWLESLSSVEARSVRRVEESEIFAGVTRSELQYAGGGAVKDGSIHLRDGWDELLTVDAEYLVTNNDANKRKQVSETLPGLSISIISVSWSTSYIKGALQHASKHSAALPSSSRGDSWFLQRAVTQLDIRANEIDGIDRAEGSTGLMHSAWEPSIRTSRDKFLALREILHENEDVSANDPAGFCTMYVGDSPTDLECLLAADVGICVRDEPMGSGQQSLSDALERVRVDVRHVGEYNGLCKGTLDIEGTHALKRLYWARDLREVASLVKKVCI